MKKRWLAGILSLPFLMAGTSGFPADDPSSPRALYLKYHAAIFAAKDVEELKPYLSQTALAQIKASPASDRPMMFGMMQTMTPHKVDVVSEKIEGSKATLSITAETTSNGFEEKTTGTISLVREGDDWKIDKEAYDSKSTSTKP
jgi:hypothetical protein